MEHKAQCSLWHFKAPLCISTSSAPGKDTFVTVLHHTRCPKGCCCCMKETSFMVNLTLSVKPEAHQWSTRRFQSSAFVAAPLMTPLPDPPPAAPKEPRWAVGVAAFLRTKRMCSYNSQPVVVMWSSWGLLWCRIVGALCSAGGHAECICSGERRWHNLYHADHLGRIGPVMQKSLRDGPSHRLGTVDEMILVMWGEMWFMCLVFLIKLPGALKWDLRKGHNKST